MNFQVETAIQRLARDHVGHLGRDQRPGLGTAEIALLFDDEGARAGPGGGNPGNRAGRASPDHENIDLSAGRHADVRHL
jgi:hypothetical protein